MEKNLAAILTRQKSNLKILELNTPNPPQGYALVKMKFSGICHTQLNEISGILGKDRFLPHCLGHEGVGEIVSIGKKVSNFKKGDNVVVSWVKKKKDKKILNTFYTSGKKKINTGGSNTLLNYSLVSEDRLFKLSSRNKYLRESVLLGCAIPTASSAILENITNAQDKKVLIMGMGGLGYASFFVLKYIGCKEIVCIDSNAKRLKLLKKNKSFIKINKKNIKDFVHKNYEIFDLIIDCTGSKKLIESTFPVLKKYVGKFVLIGNTKINEKLSIKAWDIIFSKTLTGAWGNQGVLMKNFYLNEKIFLNQIKNIKKVLPKKNYNLKNINKAISDFKKGKVLRPIIKF